MKVEDIKTSVVIGAGIMGIGIGQSLAQAGLTVRLIDVNTENLSRGLVQVESNLRLFAEYRLLKENIVDIMSRFSLFEVDRLEVALKGCDLVIEAIPEILQSKRDLFAHLDSLPDNVVIGSNTSSFTVSMLTEGMRTPQRVVGLHYFNPAHIMPLVEIHRGKDTAEEVIEVARALMLKTGKTPIVLKKEITGFVINRLQNLIGRESTDLVDQGVVTAEEMDLATKSSLGFRLACIGLNESCDIMGLDTVYRAQLSIKSGTGPSPSLAEKVKKGELGVKTGKGWYDYTGKTMAQVLEERDRKLLQQLDLFSKMHKNYKFGIP
jgi:3-hydroxybutyryl-CoA dehydrogenase